jgi:hypothetical protein
MRLVLIYSVGDCCTWSADVVLPIISESAEAAFFELENEIRKYEDPHHSVPDEFVFDNHTICRSDFYHMNWNDRKQVYTPPQILTLDEWYSSYERF